MSSTSVRDRLKFFSPQAIDVLPALCSFRWRCSSRPTCEAAALLCGPIARDEERDACASPFGWRSRVHVRCLIKAVPARARKASMCCRRRASFTRLATERIVPKTPRQNRL